MSILVIIDRLKEPNKDVLTRILEEHAEGSNTNIQLVNLTDHSIDNDIRNLNSNVTYIDGFDIYIKLMSNVSKSKSRYYDVSKRLHLKKKRPEETSTFPPIFQFTR